VHIGNCNESDLEAFLRLFKLACDSNFFSARKFEIILGRQNKEVTFRDTQD